MFFSSTALSALGAISLFASAGHAAAPHQILQYRRQAAAGPAASPGFVQVPLAQLQMLKSEYDTFHGWMTTYFASVKEKDPQVAQLDQDVQAYDIWINAFLSRYVNSTTPQGALATPVPATSSAAGDIVTGASPTTSGSSENEPTGVDSLPNASQSATAAAGTAPAPPYPAPMNSSATSSSTTTFNAQSQRNVAVYYGQTPHTNKVTVDQLCQDQNVDIVVLSFLDTFFGPAGLPNINIGPACSGDPTVGAQAINATGVLDCPFLAKNITTCQKAGKKVFLSLGGASGTTNFTSDTQATSFASTVWNLFGGGNLTSNMRPFGSVKVDGFDIDNEDHSTDHYNTFVSALRAAFVADKSKQYYISAAPQCPRPDESIPLQAMQSMDFVFVQFYNNEAAKCDIGQPGFVDSLKAWSGDLSGNSTTPGKGPKLFVGAPACPKCAGKGYLEPKDMGGVIKSAMAANITNFGGVMLWDGAEGKLNTADGGDYIKVVKSAMG